MLRCARAVDQPARFLAGELARRERFAEYTVQGRWLRFRHHSHDSWVFHEVFVERVYDLPPAHPRPARIADLGGNVGMFALHCAIRWPGAELVAFEPDPANAERYQSVMHHNRIAGELVAACAAPHPGTVRFTLGEESLAHVTADGSGAEIPAVDAFPYLESADLIKMDIEGGEWALLLDPRFRALPASTVLMEYHPHLCPSPDPRATAVDALRGAGYAVAPILEDPDTGVGMLRGIRPVPGAGG